MNPLARFLAAAKCQPVDRPPVWMMRQAGRYLPAYRAVRDRHKTLTMMHTPELAAALTLQPLEILGVDAAILYSDILMVPEAMGMKLEFVAGEGPHLAPAIRDHETARKLNEIDVAGRTPFVAETIKLIRKKIGADFPLLGFAGAPFTVATYMIAGKSSTNHTHLRRLMKSDPKLLEYILEKITVATIDYLKNQIRAGVDAVQLFDTWAGILTPDEHHLWALPFCQKIFRALGETVPTILYTRDAEPLLKNLARSGANVISIDGKTPLGQARRIVGENHALQGNLDPQKLLESPEQIFHSVEKMCADFGRGHGYIMNLGHGIFPEVPLENALAFVQACQQLGRQTLP